MSAPLGDPATRVARIDAKLRAAFAPTLLEVHDDSAAHKGHAGALTGKGHFRVRIESPQLAGLSLIARHRAVYAALAVEMDEDIHALAIEAR